MADPSAVSNIERIASFSYPSNHLLTFQLIKDLSNQSNLKPDYFFLVNLIPGEGTTENSTGRTYNFKSISSVKYMIHEIAGLAFALKQYATGRGKYVNYTKFSKSNSGQKIVSLTETSKQQSSMNSEITVHSVLFKITVKGGTTQSVSLTLDQTYSIAEMLELMFKKGAELEFNKQLHTVSYNSNNSRPQQSNNKQSRQFNPDSNSNTSDDNTSFLSRSNNEFGSPFK